VEPIMATKGDSIPVSLMPADGTFPTATTQYEKRNLALEIPVWDEKTCIQCGKCAAVCPHASIRMKVYDAKHLAGAPAAFKSCDARSPEWKGLKFTIQVAAEDCTRPVKTAPTSIPSNGFSIFTIKSRNGW